MVTKLVIVEDSNGIRRAMRRSLPKFTNYNFEIEEFKTPKEFLHWLYNCTETTNYIFLLDIILEDYDYDGVNLAKLTADFFSKMSNKIAVIFLTGCTEGSFKSIYDMIKNFREDFPHIFKEVYIKPFEIRKLANHLDELTIAFEGEKQ